MDTPTSRGDRTRLRLLAAAREVFEDLGFQDSKLSDITAKAECSTGTFYLYFTDKKDVLHVILEQVQSEMLNPAEVPHPGHESIRDRIAASNRAYLESYQRNAGAMKLLDQVAAIDPDFREVRRRRSDAFVQRNARAISALQERGLADRGLDPYVAAKALSAMVSRSAFHAFCFDEPIELDLLAATCTDLWVNALRLPNSPDDPRIKGDHQ